jgi:hypothetical protein
VFRIVLIVLGVLFLVLAFFRLNIRQVDRTGLCGSIVQGSTHDDGGSSTSDCNHLRHRDGVTAVAFVIIGIAALGVGVGHAFYTRNR